MTAAQNMNIRWGIPSFRILAAEWMQQQQQQRGLFHVIAKQDALEWPSLPAISRSGNQAK